MIALPAATPVTRPVVGLTVAMVGALLDHVPPVAVEVKVDVPLTQIPCVPLSVPADGVAVTVTDRVAVPFEQPPVPVMV